MHMDYTPTSYPKGPDSQKHLIPIIFMAVRHRHNHEELEPSLVHLHMALSTVRTYGHSYWARITKNQDGESRVSTLMDQAGVSVQEEGSWGLRDWIHGRENGEYVLWAWIFSATAQGEFLGAFLLVATAPVLHCRPYSKPRSCYTGLSALGRICTLFLSCNIRCRENRGEQLNNIVGNSKSTNNPSCFLLPVVTNHRKKRQ